MAVESITVPRGREPSTGSRTLRALATLSRRRFSLTAHTPREIFVPLLTPVLFAVVIAPALATALGSFRPDVDYMSFVAIATVGLLVPLNTMFSGIGVIVDRESGARRELLTAPIPRMLVVLGNMSVALVVTALQVVVLIGFAALRGADFTASAGGIGWFIGAGLLLAIGMYGAAETMANRIPRQEEYVAAVPAVAIVPWFFAGSLFPIGALPAGLTMFARVLPLTHTLALMRYGLGVDPRGIGLHDIWGLTSPTVMAGLSLAVVAAFAVVMTTLAIRVFTRSAVR